ncbi:MAG TPA: 3-hydroxyacyl-CoA dehydrogenase family protein [Puia sp.]|nr:3-hydroxyacyl-CoA dehydrogenase family protein [Puia sp.]
MVSILQRSAASGTLQNIALAADPVQCLYLCRNMTIAAISENHIESELRSLFPGENIQWLVFRDPLAALEWRSAAKTAAPGIALYLDLEFKNEPERLENLGRLLPALVFVNAVTPTLGEIQRPLVRINAWPGFATKKVHELVSPDEATTRRIAKLYQGLDCSYRLVPDIPGMISPRIVAGIINEAWYTWEAKVSTKEEIDTAMKLGTNYPLGPFEWGERIGLDRVAGLLRVLSKTDPRYAPANALQQATHALKCD